jgi:hypothetical protein
MVDRQRDLGRNPEAATPAALTERNHYYDVVLLPTTGSDSMEFKSRIQEILRGINETGGTIARMYPATIRGTASEGMSELQVVIVDVPKRSAEPTSQET